MITVIAKLKVKPGKGQALELAARELIAHVKANEPGTRTYVFLRSTGDPGTYAFYEVYADEGAFAAHGGSGPMQAFFGALGGLLDGRPEIAMYDELDAKR